MYCCVKKVGGREYQPNYKKKPLALKFYAYHDSDKFLSENKERYEFYANEVEKHLKYDNRDRYCAPITENQSYGWLERSALKYTGLDREILIHNKPNDEIMNVMKQIAYQTHVLKVLKV